MTGSPNSNKIFKPGLANCSRNGKAEEYHISAGACRRENKDWWNPRATVPASFSVSKHPLQDRVSEPRCVVQLSTWRFIITVVRVDSGFSIERIRPIGISLVGCECDKLQSVETPTIAEAAPCAYACKARKWIISGTATPAALVGCIDYEIGSSNFTYTENPHISNPFKPRDLRVRQSLYEMTVVQLRRRLR